ncbi:MAG TPA: hypothetical protein VFB06_36350, partial [Streptosporangiaceae bacterium]|nr:hypothetical protein [Streptosporangiaceae bacterium]
TETFDRYLSEVDASLPGPARDHRVILAELRSGLLDATDARVAAGLPHAKAVARHPTVTVKPAAVNVSPGHRLAELRQSHQATLYAARWRSELLRCSGPNGGNWM